jgi:FAD/FMN-containing dehydrogenase
MPTLSELESNADSFWLLDELKVPFPVAEAFEVKFTKLLSEHGLNGGMFGQLGDGKLHVFLSQAQNQDVERFLDELKTEAVNLGGTFSGKFSRLNGKTADNPLASLELAFKKKIDPKLIFNRLTEVAQ